MQLDSYLGVPFTPGSETSRAAAEFILPHIDTFRKKVLWLLVRSGEHGMTDQEVEGVIGCVRSTNQARRLELQRDGLVADSGRTRLTPSGCKATVWVATERGRKECPYVQ